MIFLLFVHSTSKSDPSTHFNHAEDAGPGPGKGPGALLLATRLEPAMSHEPRAEQNAKNEPIRS